MDNKKQHNYMAVAYKLYAAGEKTLEFVEEATDEQPFVFISGFGFTLDEFERQLLPLEKGTDFKFTLTKDNAYGDHLADRVVNLEREVFSINGHFDHEHVTLGAILPLQDEEGRMFHGKVVELTDTHVKVDLNHPLAGKELNFNGHMVENREATDEEIRNMLNHLNHEGCGCDGCDECNEHHQQHGGCGCGHCH